MVFYIVFEYVMNDAAKLKKHIKCDNNQYISRNEKYIYAAIDIGTHNCRLLVAKPENNGFRVIDSFSRIVRLGEGVVASGILSEKAQLRALEALQICADKLSKRDITSMRAVATQACRIADNGRDFIKRVLDVTGIDIDVIDTKEEAKLAIGGCLSLMNDVNPYAVIFDIGGGSTQVILVSQLSGEPEIVNSISIPFGVVTLGERIGTDNLSIEIYEYWIDVISKKLQIFSYQNKINDKIDAGLVQMLGASGTVTTLTGINLALPRYLRSAVDGAYLDFEAARIISSNLRRKNLEERASHPCIGDERADLVLAGCIILESICKLWPVGSLRVADRGVREGILHDLMNDGNIMEAQQ